MSFELTRELLDELKEAADQRNDGFIKEQLDELYAPDISSILDEMDEEQCKYILEVLDKPTSAEIISNMDPDTREGFLKQFSSEELAQYINFVDSDDAADILNEQPIRTREEVIALLENREKARHIRDLLHYEEDTAGGLMAKELVKCNIHWTVVQCVDEIRRQAENVEKVNSVYVVDEKGILKGRVSLKKIVLARASTRVADIYEDDIVSVETFRPADEIATIMRRYDLESVPVVNVHGKLLGRITIDDIVDVITEQAELERQAMSGISADIEENDSVLMLTRARLPWLTVGLVGGLLGAGFIGFFEGELARITEMAFFIPLITATGGNVGIQSSSLILQSLANRSLLQTSISQRLLKVLFVAILNGLALALLVFSYNYVLYNDAKLAGVVAIALFSVVLLASFMGTITPLVLDKVGINPAVASGPFITTANDLLGLMVYFMTARLLYGL